MTPTNTEKVLGSDPDGKPPNREWKYASVIGMLLYLASNSRPDITFAVHQCARFTHSTKKSHEDAVLRICQYLKGTASDGLIYQPDGTANVDCYIDSDFAGIWC